MIANTLSGLEGIFLRNKGRHRMVVSVTLLQRSVAVEVEPDWVLPSEPAWLSLRMAFEKPQVAHC